MHQTDRTTVKLTLEGLPELVEAITEALRRLDGLTVVSVSRDQHVALTENVRRTLRLRQEAGQ